MIKRLRGIDEVAIKEELNRSGARRKCIKWANQASKAGWGGRGIALGGNAPPRRPTKEQKKKARMQGSLNGCHSCGKKPNAPWIADHIPPKELTLAQITALGIALAGYKISYRFFPHCETCATRQAQLVKKIISGTVNAGNFPMADLNLILDPRDALSISGRKTKASKAQKLTIQGKGEANGCHTCTQRAPSKNYIADHIPPADFGKNYMKTALDIMKIRVKPWELRPHCRSCSNRQGNEIRSLTANIRNILETNGVTTY